MTTHRHFVDDRPHFEIDPTVCLQSSGDGAIWINFDPPQHDDLRQLGRVEFGKGQWAATGSLEAGNLTVKPSIRISTTADGKPVVSLHGFIRKGKWVPA